MNNFIKNSLNIVTSHIRNQNKKFFLVHAVLVTVK